MSTVLTIAGSDPSGGAGIQRDLRVFSDFKCNGLSAITALTAQNSKKVNAVFPIPARFVKRQIGVLVEEYKIDGLKTGMLAAEGIVKVVVGFLKRRQQKNIVVDPVFVSTSGYPLLEKKGVARLKSELIPLADIVTPNLFEAHILSGIKINGIDEMHSAAERIKRLGCKAVLVKGGHLHKISNSKSQISNDVLYDGEEFKLFKTRRVQKDLHGTGCILSAGIAAGLANGLDMQSAIKKAKRHVTRMLIQI
ncbi:MAG: bifunctional hydroxymethylpyrimidine kinase/phosphomethylpyrimidine kinase [Deltaproteobacteria bacterium]|nr:bifunctional hydroxymethylpyrimidine kinase/phosphomethylpyrimidine kinase [Deltaproteobacteria bacterium]